MEIHGLNHVIFQPHFDYFYHKETCHKSTRNQPNRAFVIIFSMRHIFDSLTNQLMSDVKGTKTTFRTVKNQDSSFRGWVDFRVPKTYSAVVKNCLANSEKSTRRSIIYSKTGSQKNIIYQASRLNHKPNIHRTRTKPKIVIEDTYLKQEKKTKLIPRELDKHSLSNPEINYCSSRFRISKVLEQRGGNTAKVRRPRATFNQWWSRTKL